MSLRAVLLSMRTLLSEQIGYVITVRALHSRPYLNLHILIDFQLQCAIISIRLRIYAPLYYPMFQWMLPYIKLLLH